MRILRFNEKNLNLAELEKTAKEGGIRGDVLVKKLKKQIEDSEDISGQLSFKPENKPGKISSVENPEEIIDNITTGNSDTYDIEKATQFFYRKNRYAPVFKTDTTDYKLNDIEKTDEFGSSGGSSLGTKETRNVESIQCLYCALRQNLNRPITEEDFDYFFDQTGYIKEELMNYIKVGGEVNPENLEKYRVNWERTFLTTANALFEYRQAYTVKGEKKSVLDDTKKYTFYQIGFDGGLNLVISNKFKSLVGKMQIAKWNPADMWAVDETSTERIKQRIERSRTIEELNTVIDRNFDRRDLVGVSLKKVRNLPSANLLVNKVTARPTYQFSTIRTSFNPLNSLGVNILMKQFSELKTENRDIQLVIRSFAGPDTLGDVSGEIIGSTSRHGKVGLSEINQIFKRVSLDYNINIPLVPTHKQLEKVTDEELLTTVRTLNEMIGRLGDKSREMKSEKTSTRVRLISKYQALLIAKNLFDFKGFSSEICKKMMYYALAIENSRFECPKYVRVL